MTNKRNYYYKLHDIQKLNKEKSKLMKEYEAAIHNDLPFHKTKEIFLRLKEIKQLLDNTEQIKQHQSQNGNLA